MSGPYPDGQVAVWPRIGHQLQEDGRVGRGLVGEAPPQLQSQRGVQGLAVELRLGVDQFLERRRHIEGHPVDVHVREGAADALGPDAQPVDVVDGQGGGQRQDHSLKYVVVMLDYWSSASSKRKFQEKLIIS